MTAKEYLGQAYRIDQRINSKMEQIASLNLLAQKATTVFNDMPGNSTRNIHRNSPWSGGAENKLQHRVGERALSAARTESCRVDESPSGCGTFFASRCT